MKGRAALFILVTILISGAAVAQEPTVISGQVTSATDGQPLPGAIVSAPDLSLTTTTDAEGRYTLTVPPGSGPAVELEATSPDHAPFTVEVTLAPGSVTQDFSLGVGFYESITVGSRAAGAEAEKSVPVDVFQIEDLQTTGASETNQILESLTPSFNFPRPTITDGTDTVRPATLRGLGSDQAWCWSTASAGIRAPWSTSTAASAAARPGSTSTPSRPRRSRRSRSCATAPPPSTARTRSPGSSTWSSSRARPSPSTSRAAPPAMATAPWSTPPSAMAGRSAAARSSPRSSTATARTRTAPGRTPGRRAP